MGLVKSVLSKASENIRQEGFSGVSLTARQLVRIAQRKSRLKFVDVGGANVYDQRWDVLILLDCARVDMMEEVRDEYSFIEDIGTHQTNGTNSPQWMRNTFREPYEESMSQTVYITANGNSDQNLDTDDFFHLDEVWRDGWDQELSTIPASKVTDRAIYYGRQLDFERMIVHYMQPHLPFIPRPENESAIAVMNSDERTMYLQELHEEAGYSRNELWGASVDNLRYVLDSVKQLLSNLDADRVVISSDHGQSFGENGIWGHPPSRPIDVLQTVPWCVTSATDKQTYTPEHDPSGEPEQEEISVGEKLRALGYR